MEGSRLDRKIYQDLIKEMEELKPEIKQIKKQMENIHKASISIKKLQENEWLKQRR